ncbi:MAG: DUF5916 domain-containing protein [Vicinamibacterales bacterium]
MIRRALLGGLGLGVAVAAAAAEPAVTIVRVQQAPRLETYLTVEADRLPGAIQGFVQREPRDGRPASRPTTAFLFYDEHNLYAIVICRDEPAGIRARYARRDAIDADDRVALYLDTFHDRQRAYVFAVNPVGVQSDAVVTEGQEDDPSFDTLWYSEARLTEFGYGVKMTIPFRSLRFSRALEQTWGLALSREVRRLDEEDFWPEVSKRSQSKVAQFAEATGVAGVAPGANAQFIPYAVYTDAREGAAAAERVARAGRYGLDAKVGLGPSFVVDGALNPDFSEVETDDPQVTVNERFEVFFPERRPFFIENAGYFATPTPLFFSRRLRDPAGGGRVTGKAGPWVVAALAMRDRATPDTDAATAAVAAVRREFASGSRVGVLVTSRAGEAVSNQVVSVDGRLTLGRNWALSAQAMRSGTAGAAVRSAGTGLMAEAVRDGRHLDLTARYTDLAPGFDATLGFVPQVDIRRVDGETSYQWRPRGGVLSRFGPRLDGYAIADHAGVRQEWRVRPRFDVEFVDRTRLRVERSESLERYRGVDVRKWRHGLQAEMDADWGGFEASWEWGVDINRRPPAGALPGPVARRALEVAAVLTPGRHVKVQPALLLTRLDEVGPKGGGAAGRVLANDIARLKLHAQLTTTVALRAILDYERTAASPLLSAVRSRQGASLDLLGTIQVNPGTAFYVGYVHRLQPIDPEGRPLFTPFESVGRQLFVKASVLFRQ